MKLLVLLFLQLGAVLLQAREVTDMAGRKVTVPDTPLRVLAYDAKTAIALFRCAGKTVIAKGALPGKKNYSFISSDFQNIPSIDVKNIETILVTAPNLVVVGCFLPEDIGQYNELQQKIAIPIVVIDLSIEKLDKTYLFLGKLLNRESECVRFAHYFTTLYNDWNVIQKLHSKPKATAYYALGADGLTTDPSQSKHTELFDVLKIQNVAQVDMPSGGHARANMEQLLLWNPEYIFAAVAKDEPNPFTLITTQAQWANISAVKNHRVYKIPCEPMSWFDHPPSINRIPGMLWLQQIFYEQPAEVTKRKIVEFFSLFYGYDLTNNDYATLFK